MKDRCDNKTKQMQQEQAQKDEKNSIDKNELHEKSKQNEQDEDRLADEHDDALRNTERLKEEALERNNECSKTVEKDEAIENMSKQKQMLERKLSRSETSKRELIDELD